MATSTPFEQTGPDRPSGPIFLPPPQRPVIERMSDTAWGFLEDLGQMSIMLARMTRALFSRPFEFRSIIYQLDALGVRSLGITLVTSIFIGMVMAVQFAISLQKFGAMEYTGRVVGLSFARELAPTLTAVIVGGMIGAGMAAEVGSMTVTEQVDAIRALGADPIKKLVLPRVVASVLVMPLLAVIALLFGFCGAMFVTSLQFKIGAEFFLRTALNSVSMHDFFSGAYKTPFFGAIIAITACHCGMNTSGGTEGVGRSTTRSVVMTSISILIADFFLTKLYFVLFGK